MTESSSNSKITRRKLLVGMAAAGGLAAAGTAAGFAISELAGGGEEKLVPEPSLTSVAIGKPVPATDPESGLWGKAKAQRVELLAQTVIQPLKSTTPLPWVRVRSLHDGENIAFLLEWDDPVANEHTIKIDQYRDACGVFLGPSGAPATLWTMGMPENPVTILHWKADWQKDVDAGFQDLEVAFPNAAFDYYPPLVGAQLPLKLPDAYPVEARVRLPGWHVGNPLSQPVKQVPVEKLRAIGPGTLEHLPTQNVTGRGIWKDGRWKVVLTKPMKAVDPEEITIEPGSTYALAFTVWSGADGDRGSRKSITKLGQLAVEAS